jgi:glycosyltransferase involved in cell wall biosynthesis
MSSTSGGSLRSGERPLVTIAVPTYNRARFLAETIKSAQRQTYPNLEIIVADNASCDDTEAVVCSSQEEDPRIRYVRNSTNLGMVGNWNVLLREARGTFFLLLSDDDLIDPGAIAGLVPWVLDSRVAFVYCKAYRIDAGGRPYAISRSSPRRERGVSFVMASLREKRDVCPAAVLCRTSQVVADGGFPDTGATTDFAQRLVAALHGDVVFVDRPLARYRIHPAMESMNFGSAMESRIRFREWAARPTSPLQAFGAQIDRWLVRSTKSILVSAAVRRNGAGMEEIALALRRLAVSEWRIRLIQSLYGNPVTRAVWDLRRRLRALRAEYSHSNS